MSLKYYTLRGFHMPILNLTICYATAQKLRINIPALEGGFSIFKSTPMEQFEKLLYGGWLS